jgi:predicted DNA-binding transcriptional regulator AlpA
MNAQQSQSSRIKELGDALVATGFLTLDQQAQALGLARSTTWTIVQANHKSSGLSAGVINRMLRAPQLPPLVRAAILTYIAEKTAGLYGHNELQVHRFAARLSDQHSGDLRTKLAADDRAARKQFGRVPQTFVAVADPG